jgi:MarR family transcriptional regulator, transcriptional regulator for hemolysin
MRTEPKRRAPTDQEAVADALQSQLWKLIRGLERCDQEFLSRYGVSAAQGEAVLAFPGSGSTSMNELSRSMGLANSTMTRMVEHLVSRGLVSRADDAEDRRVVLVALTSEGRKLQGSLKEARMEIQRMIFSEIRPAERNGVLDVMRRLNTALEKALKDCCGD